MLVIKVLFQNFPSYFLRPSFHCHCCFVQSLGCVRLFVTPWIAAHQAPLSFTVSRSLLRLRSIESGMLSISSSAAPFSFCLRSFPASGSFPMSWPFTSGGQSIGPSASVSVLPMNIQGFFPLGLMAGLFFLQSKVLSRVFSSTTVQNQFFGA